MTRYSRQHPIFRLICMMSIGLLFISSDSNAEAESLFGKWGTEAQCEEKLIIPKGTKRASPFSIQQDWLGHGDVWCRLIWLSVQSSPNKTVGFANALCGEDNVRDYRIKFQLTAEKLSISWGIGSVTNGPLSRCELGSEQGSK